MKKTHLHGEIKNKYLIKDNISGNVVLEKCDDETEMNPAVFNYPEDAELYLQLMEVGHQERLRINIECTDISFFNHGVILVEDL